MFRALKCDYWSMYDIIIPHWCTWALWFVSKVVSRLLRGLRDGRVEIVAGELWRAKSFDRDTQLPKNVHNLMCIARNFHISIVRAVCIKTTMQYTVLTESQTTKGKFLKLAMKISSSCAQFLNQAVVLEKQEGKTSDSCSTLICLIMHLRPPLPSPTTTIS